MIIEMFLIALTMMSSKYEGKQKALPIGPPCAEMITVCEPNGDGEVCYPIDPWPPCSE